MSKMSIFEKLFTLKDLKIVFKTFIMKEKLHKINEI